MTDPAEAEERARAREELEWRRTRYDLGAFIEKAAPAGYVRPYWLAPVLELFDRIERGESVYAVVEAPPRHTKTETLLGGAVRALRHRPSTRVLYTSHSAEIANEKSRFARDMALRAGLWVGHVDAADRHDPARTVRFWQTGDGGAFMALGRGGRPIGRGFQLVLVDDPFGDLADAESPVIQDQVWSWFKGSLFSRVEPGGSIIVAHQRWNDADLIGRIREEIEAGSAVPWETVSLPAINAEGAPLWPERWSLDELALKRSGVGEYIWAGNYMQAPVRKGSKLFREPQRWGSGRYDMMGARLVIACDPAATASTSSDRSSVGLGALRGYEREQTLDLLRAWTLRVEIPELCDFLEKLQKRFSCPIVVESVAGFRSVPQILRRVSPLSIEAATSSLDKFTRWQPASAAWNRGAIRLPSSSDDAYLESPLVAEEAEDWLVDYLGAMGRVTGVRDRRDDDADMTQLMWDWGQRQIDGDATEGARGPREASELGGY